MKYSSAGAQTWASSYDSPAHGTDVCRTLAYGYGGRFAAGFQGRSMLDTSALLIRYEP